MHSNLKTSASRGAAAAIVAGLSACVAGLSACVAGGPDPLGPMSASEMVTEDSTDGEESLEDQQAGPEPIMPAAPTDTLSPEVGSSPSDAGTTAQSPLPPPELEESPALIDPFDAQAVCSSGTYWSGKASATMHPGLACIGCHSNSPARPQFKIAGTAYPTAHEPDDCNAKIPSGVHVEIVGADGRRVELQVNEVGNFFSLETIAVPYTARVISQGRARSMLTPQRSGDCNSCHTQAGDHGAPGRILLP